MLLTDCEHLCRVLVFAFCLVMWHFQDTSGHTCWRTIEKQCCFRQDPYHESSTW